MRWPETSPSGEVPLTAPAPIRAVGHGDGSTRTAAVSRLQQQAAASTNGGTTAGSSPAISPVKVRAAGASSPAPATPALSAVKVCVGCGEGKPIEEFPIARRKGGKEWRRRRCRSCENAHRIKALRSDPERLKRKRELDRQDIQWRLSVPALAERRRETQRRHRAKVEADPERRERQRLKQREYRAKVQADPVRRERRQRMSRERRARAAEREKAAAAARLPSRHLALAVTRVLERRVAVMDEEKTSVRVGEGIASEFEALTGISARALYGWREGERTTIGLEQADAVLTVFDLFWWEVFSEENMRLPLIEARVYQRVMKKRVSGEYRPHRMTRRVKFYGDAGPDLKGVEAVRRVFEPEG